MALGDFTAPDRLRDLLEFLTDRGKHNHRFENFSIHNISSWMLAGKFPEGHMRIYGYPSDKPYYVFMIEENEHQFPHVQVRTPSAGHRSALLKESLIAVLTLVTPALEKHGQLMLESDTTVQAMTDFKAPDGFRIGTVDVVNDYAKMYAVYHFKSTTHAEMLRFRLENLPSSCVRAEDGSLAAWEMVHSFGHLTHLFAHQPYRGKGLGLLAEHVLAQIIARQGLQVYKYVSENNTDVLKGTMKDPLWSTWKSLKNGKESDEKEKDIMWTFNIFKYRRGQEY